MSVLVVGLDLSLTSSGIATIEHDGIGVRSIETWTIGSKRLGDTLDDRWRRLRDLARRIADQVHSDVNLVVVEQPAYGSQTGHMHDRSGLWWLVVAGLHAQGVPVAEVAPSTLKKFATGRGNASKEAVLLATARAWPALDLGGNDEADALNLAAMGMAHHGHLNAVGVGAWTKAKGEAVAKVAWPAQDRLP